MLRAFIAESYAAQPVHEIAAQLVDVMPSASAADRVRAAQVPVLLADLVDIVEQVVIKADENAHVHGFAGGLLTYVYNPLDLLTAEGIVGWLDDTIVCAVGLRRLHDDGLAQLDEPTLALCDVAREAREHLNPELASAIADFIEALWQNSSTMPAATGGAPATAPARRAGP
ncbi:MAG: hypothetical protein M5U28_13895 [Sandaracinaceae bacterium]|nr:hypothetical protein [Sandaracinaceae bacterium]